jgi:hypothetical protein
MAIDFLYNERPYMDRGWCCFEDAVSEELLARLTPNMRAGLQLLPPKMVSLDGETPGDVAEWVGTRVERVAERIVNATFTGAADKPRVLELYRAYAERIAQTLMPLLAQHATPGSPRLSTAPLPTAVALPSPPPLCYAPNQPLLTGTQFGVASASGRLSLTLAGGEVEIAFDACVQEALPWRPSGVSLEALRRDVEGLRDLDGRASSLLVAARAPPTDAGLRALTEGADALVRAAAALPSMASVARDAHKEVEASLQAASGALEAVKMTPVEREGAAAADARARELHVHMEAARAAMAALHPEALAAAGLRASGAVGVRRYAPGQQLVVWTGGAWRDADVEGESDAAHRLRLTGGGEASLALHPWDHAPREVPSDAFARLHEAHTATLRAQHSHIVDPISGDRLDALEQCVAIDVSGEMAVVDAHSLSAWLLDQYEGRRAGRATQAEAALLTAGPAAGKTTLMSQVVMLSLESALVPILVRVQRLQRWLLDEPGAFLSAWNWMDAFARLEYTEPHYRFLRQAMMARRALLLLDGLDEGGAKRAEIEAHIAGVLVPQGHVLLCTSRPAGVDEARFAHFRRLQLSPLTRAQQQEALTTRIGAHDASKLLAYIEGRMATDETGQHVTSNPLMLSMVASVFQMRGDLGMPTTVAELYAVASDAMLARGGRVTEELRALLRRIFFEVHVAQDRVVHEWQLDAAALGLEAPEALAALRERATRQQPLEPIEGRAELGHYVEVVEGEDAGKRGVVTSDDKSGNPYKVTFADGKVSGRLTPGRVHSSGLGESTFLSRAMAARAWEVREACAQLSEAARGALEEVKRRVQRDDLPLLSLLQTEPLQVQASHLSFQEFFAARELCGGTRLAGSPPWQWPAWWANALRFGGEMEGFGKGLRRTVGVGEELDLSQKLGGDRATALRAVMLMEPTSLKWVPPTP